VPAALVDGEDAIRPGLEGPGKHEVRGQVEPLIAEDGQPRLRVHAAFEIRLTDPFGIAGPDGPVPARDTLQFFLDFQLEPRPENLPPEG